MVDRSRQFSLEGPLAPPLANGELAFDEPWQGRVFGMAWALCERGCFEWREFQASLIAAIASNSADDATEYAYYDHFQEALESLLVAKGLASAEQLAARHKVLVERPHDHDHWGYSPGGTGEYL